MAAFKDIATDALRYWERRRLIYNGVLAAIVVGTYVMFLPESRKALNHRTLFELLALTVVANILYCAAYIPDVFVQCSDFRDSWRRWRWVLFVTGTLLAAALAAMVALVVWIPWLAD